MRTLWFAALPLIAGLAMTGIANAGDGDNATDSRTMSEKISDGFYGMIRGTNMDNRGIDYRERSPLVVPSTLDLPPPVASTDVNVANWPKDPDERQRKAIIAAKKKNAPPPGRVFVTTEGQLAAGQAARPINIAPPAEEQPVAAAGTTRPAYANDRNGTARIDPVYDQPGNLFTGGASDLLPSSVSDSFDIGNLFGTKKEAPPPPPGTEPARQALTQPPVGYQVPSANYSYGVEPKGVFDGTANPEHNPLAERSSASSVVH